MAVDKGTTKMYLLSGGFGSTTAGFEEWPMKLLYDLLAITWWAILYVLYGALHLAIVGVIGLAHGLRSLRYGRECREN